MPDTRDTSDAVEPQRSRKEFRFMPASVISHELRDASGADSYAPGRSENASALTVATFGRGLYGRKVAPDTRIDRRVDSLEDGLKVARRDPARLPLTLWHWQPAFRYLILLQRRNFALTWHAPWCRACECPGAGWRFSVDDGYASGLGFELSYARQ